MSGLRVCLLCFLRAATRVPVVMKQCITCHPGSKEGDLLGALVYEVPIK